MLTRTRKRKSVEGRGASTEQMTSNDFERLADVFPPADSAEPDEAPEVKKPARTVQRKPKASLGQPSKDGEPLKKGRAARR